MKGETKVCMNCDTEFDCETDYPDEDFCCIACEEDYENKIVEEE